MKKPVKIPPELVEKIDAGARLEDSEALRIWAEQGRAQRRLLERLIETNQAFDQKIRLAIDDVDVPEGLENRLIAAAGKADPGENQPEWPGRDADWIEETLSREWMAERDSARTAELVGHDGLISDSRDATRREFRIRMRAAVWVVASMAVLLLVSFAGYTIWDAVAPRQQVAQTDLARESTDWLAQLEDDFEAEPAEKFASYPKCGNIEYNNLDAGKFKEIQTSFGTAKAAIHRIKDSRDSCITLTIKVRGRYWFDLGKALPETPMALISSSQYIAASIDPFNKKFVHVVVVPSVRSYQEKIWMPSETYTFLAPGPLNNSESSGQWVALESLPADWLKELERGLRPN